MVFTTIMVIKAKVVFTVSMVASTALMVAMTTEVAKMATVKVMMVQFLCQSVYSNQYRT